MLNGWGLRQPDLIISITGGAKMFDMSTGLRKAFQSGLISAAITTSNAFEFECKKLVMYCFNSIDAWLITAGTNAGVIKEIGEALRIYRYKNRKHELDIPCIGIASWGYTAENVQLDNQLNDFSIEEKNGNTYSLAKNHKRPSDYTVRMVIY